MKTFLKARLGWFILGATCFAIGWCGRSSMQEIADVSKVQRLTFSSPGSTSTVSLHVRGHIDGRASISAANWTPETISGDVKWEARHDYFSSSIVVEYEPTGVSKGYLTFELTFQ